MCELGMHKYIYLYIYEIFPYLPQILFLLNDFPQHYEISLKFYHFICYALHPRLEVLNLSGTQNCGFFSLKNELLLCRCGDAPLPASLPWFWLIWNYWARGPFLCKDRQARCWDFGISAI